MPLTRVMLRSKNLMQVNQGNGKLLFGENVVEEIVVIVKKKFSIRSVTTIIW